ncbi:ferritin heavy chain B-like [Lemur catta]|uniref:ferritin heavy chain B-like n=1 Tax=Lemur catta TaxID=9447 RepID=UPI001E268982|nr:ferritin heavy chain B-like [Lemur catta]
MGCYYSDEKQMPPLANLLEKQSNAKREHAKEFLRYLRKHEHAICLPVIQSPITDVWESGIQALKSALQLENLLTEVLEELKFSAFENDELIS